jgi:predicted PurR-regulated permease PerM
VVVTFVVIGVVVGVVSHLIFSPVTELFKEHGYLTEHHELASHFIGIVGVIYAVLVAFVVVTAWQTLDHAEDLTIQEQHNIDDLFHLDGAYPGREAENIRFMLTTYTAVMHDEWKEMQEQKALSRYCRT